MATPSKLRRPIDASVATVSMAAHTLNVAETEAIAEKLSKLTIKIIYIRREIISLVVSAKLQNSFLGQKLMIIIHACILMHRNCFEKLPRRQPQFLEKLFVLELLLVVSLATILELLSYTLT